MILPAAELERLTRLDAKPKKSFVEHLLSAPKLPDDARDLFDKREPIILEMHDIKFDD